MLPFLLTGLVALAQAAPAPHKNAAVPNNLPPNLVRDYATVSKFAKTVTSPQSILKNWTGTDVCAWEGFYCDNNPSTNVLSLASIDFNGFEMKGSLSLTGFVDKLVDLALLHLNSNGFRGDVPNLSQLNYLYEVDLSNNEFSGPFPQNIFTAPGLTFLDLRYNNFTGAIPPQAFSTWTQIEALFLNNNHFSGELPASVAGFMGKYLQLANNQLTGEIPGSIAAATNLVELGLFGNNLTGSIPTGLGALHKLELFDVSNNNLTGTVPEDLCASKSIKNIVVSGNQLSSNLGPNCKRAKSKGKLKM